jgi:hypothetical protein
MPSSRATFTTESIDLAAFLATAGFESTITCPPGSTRALFVFEASDNLHSSIVEYEQGGELPSKRLLNRRSWLFRQASAAVRKEVQR